MNGERYTYFKPQMSLYIPSVTSITSEEQIKEVFLKLNVGIVSRVDFIKKDEGYAKYMAFIHFEYWFVNDTSYHIQERIQNTGTSRIVYNDPYYWIIMENKNPRTQNEVVLEKEVSSLQKRIRYLETVIEVHSKKFMDNGIQLKTKNCDSCWIEMGLDDKICNACDYDERQECDNDVASEMTDPDMPDLESDTPQIDLRSALKNGDIEVTLNNDDSSTTPLPPIPTTSLEQNTSNWGWW